MEIITTVAQMKAQTKSWRQKGQSIGLVLTMGYLHAGHLSLIQAARANNDIVVVSIFVNPSQFGPNEDFERYPRDMAADRALCEQAGVDVIFAPTVSEMYPPGFISYVEPSDLSERLCGASRPGHFKGVATVVLKFFNIIAPDDAYFGQKDAQQFIILQKMARDFNLDIALHCLPIIREKDGLAMSSRNVYLNPEERKQALQLHLAIDAAKKIYADGERDATPIIAAIAADLSLATLAQVDYIAIVDRENLQPVEKIEGEVLVALAVFFGQTRLIDNTFLG